MEPNSPSPRRVLTAIICFLFSAITALILLVVLLIEWLTSLLESDVLATLLVAGTFLVAATMIYLLSAHRAIEQIKTRWDAIYDVAYTVRCSYNRVMRFIKLFMS